jgi:hypothetical protein
MSLSHKTCNTILTHQHRRKIGDNFAFKNHIAVTTAGNGAYSALQDHAAIRATLFTLTSAASHNLTTLSTAPVLAMVALSIQITFRYSGLKLHSCIRRIHYIKALLLPKFLLLLHLYKSLIWMSYNGSIFCFRMHELAWALDSRKCCARARDSLQKDQCGLHAAFGGPWQFQAYKKPSSLEFGRHGYREAMLGSVRDWSSVQDQRSPGP